MANTLSLIQVHIDNRTQKMQSFLRWYKQNGHLTAIEKPRTGSWDLVFELRWNVWEMFVQLSQRTA